MERPVPAATDEHIQRCAADIVRSILRESPDTFFVKDTDLRMVLCNTRLAQSINKSPEDMYGKQDIEAGWDNDFVKGNAEKGIRGWEQDDRAALSGFAVRVHDQPRTGRDGVLVGDVVKIPLRNENGEVIGIVGIGRDMTDPEAARQEMVSIVSSSDDAIISKSLDGTIRSWNPAAERMYGYSERDAVGRNVVFMVPEDRQEDLPFFMRQVGEGRHVNHYETERIRADGTRIFVSISISPIRDAAGRITGACTIARDISERRHAEAMLRESEARYRSLVENANDIIFELGLDRVVTYASPNWTMQLGHGTDQVVGRPLDDFVHPDDALAMRTTFERTIEHGERTSAEYRIRHRDGTWRWHSTNWSPILGNKTIVSFMGVARDISEAKKLEILKSRYELILKHARDVFLLARPGGDITEVNDAALGLYGYHRDEMLGMNVTALRPCDDADKVRAEFEEGRRSGVLLEAVHVRKDGSTVPVEISFQGVCVDGEELILALIRDISARKRTEQLLRESESRWRTIAAASPDGILVLSHDGTIEEASSKVLALCGYGSEAEMKGLSVFQLVDSDSRVKARARLEAKVSGAPTQTNEFLAVRKDGQRFPVEVNAEVLQGSQGDTASLVLVVRDVTEHKRLEEQFRQAQKMEAVGRLAGGVAHDFNNMLGVILGHAELAAEQIGENDPVRQDFREIQKAAQRSADLTRKLLAFARKQAVVPQVLDVNQTVKSMMDMLQRLIGEDIELVLDLAPGVWSVKVDPSQVDQILANLAINARDAITGPGTLVISTRNVGPGNVQSSSDGLPRGDYVLLSMRDNGAGMNEDTVGHLFEPFFTTKEPGKGTGLGLATVYGAVKQNGGFIRVSTAVGKGTTFRIYLPRVDAVASLLESTPRAAPGGTGTILFVEDEESILLLGRQVLRRNGYTVLAARSPVEALELAEKHPGKIDLLITDLVMPGMNGKQLSDKLAESRPETRSLFISGYTAEVISHDGIVEDGIEYLQKPFSVHVLSERVRAALSSDHGLR